MPDKDEKSATTPTGTAHWSLGLNAPTLWHSGSLINLCTCRSTMSDSCTIHYLDLGRHTLIVSSDLKAKIALSVNFSSTFTFSNVTTLRSTEPDCAEVPIDTFFWQLPSFVIFITSLHCFLFLLLEKRRDTKFRHMFPVALSSIMRDADEFRMAVNTDHTRNPLNCSQLIASFRGIYVALKTAVFICSFFFASFQYVLAFKKAVLLLLFSMFLACKKAVILLILNFFVALKMAVLLKEVGDRRLLAAGGWSFL